MNKTDTMPVPIVLTEDEARIAGIRLAKLLNLKKNNVGRYDTESGQKNAIGLTNAVLDCLHGVIKTTVPNNGDETNHWHSEMGNHE